jgi:hypothetical protein
MTTAPAIVQSRPFAIEPVTGVMLPDGIFDNAIYHLQIACYVTNTSNNDLTNVTVHFESVSDPGVSVSARTFALDAVPAGGSVLVMWDANFEHASPGKHLVSFVARADGHTLSRSIKQIFVSQTRFDPATNSYSCTVEEGTLVVSGMSAIVPRPTWGEPDDKGECRCAPPWGPNVLTGLTTVWTPNPAYAGDHGDLPFSDPWWKVLAIIVAIVAALVAIIAAASGAGTASFAAGGTFEETDPSVSCCTPETGSDLEYTVAGVASAIATGAAIVALSDAADPMWRGQEATPPAAGEVTVGERVEARWTLPDAPNAGKPYTADVEWTYTRQTTGRNYSHSVSETQANTHLAGDVELETPDEVLALDPLWVRAKFHTDDGGLFTGDALYAFAVFVAPGGAAFVRPLTDDGLNFDPAANDGVFAGALDLERVYGELRKRGQDVHGRWRCYVFAQDVNHAPEGAKPEIAAQSIGGMFVASAIHITFDPSLPCPLRANATILVS